MKRRLAALLLAVTAAAASLVFVPAAGARGYNDGHSPGKKSSPAAAAVETTSADPETRGGGSDGYNDGH